MTPWTAACQDSLSCTIFQTLLKLVSIESMIPSNSLMLCCPLLLLPSVFTSIRVFANELAPCIRSQSIEVQLQHQYFQRIFRLISFRIDWFDVLAVQRNLRSLFQHHNSKASILPSLAFFMVQLSHLYMTIRKNQFLTVWTFVGKVLSLLFNTLSRFVIAFLPRDTCLLTAVTVPRDFGAQEKRK